MNFATLFRSAVAVGAFFVTLSSMTTAQAITYSLNAGPSILGSEYSTRSEQVRITVNPGIYESGVYTRSVPGTPMYRDVPFGTGVRSDFHDTDEIGRDDSSDKAEILYLRFDTNVALTSLTFANMDSSELFNLAYDTNGDGVLDTRTAGLSASGGDYSFSDEAFANGTIFGILSATPLDAFYLQSVSVMKAPAVSAVPLPASLPLYAFGLGLLGLVSLRSKRKRNSTIA